MGTEQIYEGPGALELSTYVLEISIILLGAFILGYVLRVLLNVKYKNKIQSLDYELSMLKTKLRPEESYTKLESTIIEQQAELERTKELLSGVQEPLLRPTEIPLKLPVRLTFGMQQPRIEAVRVRREPVMGPPPAEALERAWRRSARS